MNIFLRITIAGFCRGMMSVLLANIFMTLNVNIGSPSSEIIMAPSSDVSKIAKRKSNFSSNFYVLTANFMHQSRKGTEKGKVKVTFLTEK